VKQAAVLFFLIACGPTETTAAVDPSAWEGQTPVNPSQDGRLVYRSFGDHHPDCFVFVAEEGSETETIDCPNGAIEQLSLCPAGKLYVPAGKPCICVPLDGEASEVDCPAS